MTRTLSPTGAVTIAAGQTSSEAFNIYDGSYAVGIWAPSTLPETVTVETEPTESGTEWKALTSGGTIVTIAAATQLNVFPVTFRQVRLTASAAVGAGRRFQIVQRHPA